MLKKIYLAILGVLAVALVLFIASSKTTANKSPDLATEPLAALKNQRGHSDPENILRSAEQMLRSLKLSRDLYRMAQGLDLKVVLDNRRRDFQQITKKWGLSESEALPLWEVIETQERQKDKWLKTMYDESELLTAGDAEKLSKLVSDNVANRIAEDAVALLQMEKILGADKAAEYLEMERRNLKSEAKRGRSKTRQK